jgi:hypothetical protein
MKSGMIKLSVMYPKGEGTTFNLPKANTKIQ